MAFKTNVQLQKKAQKQKYAVPAFNINNLEILKAIIDTAIKLNSPLIIQTTEGAIKYAGIDYLISLVKTAQEISKLPISLHLDHGKDLSIIKQCIKKGFSSVMIDGSSYSFEENIKITKTVVNLAHKKGVSVEAELGTLAGIEDNVSSDKIIYTDPKQAIEFIKKTGCDTLAIAIGTSHGAYKFKGESKLKIDILKQITKLTKTPIVLHGASGVSKNTTTKLQKLGMKLSSAKGVSDTEIKKAIKNGVTKINIDTDIRLAFTSGVRQILKQDNNVFDPRKILTPAMEEMKKVIESKIRLFGSMQKA